MMTRFYDSFGDRADKDDQIPDEILKEIKKDLPSNFDIIRDEKGEYHILPVLNGEGVALSTVYDIDSIEDENLLKRVKSIPRGKIVDYYYRIQKPIKVKQLTIGNEEKMIPIEETMGNPLSDEKINLTDCRLTPAPFPGPQIMAFESADGERMDIKFQQQPYDSLTEVLLRNIDHPEFKIEIYIYDPIVEGADEKAKTSKEIPTSANYQITPSEASNVEEAVRALKIFAGLFDGTTKVNGEPLISDAKRRSFDPQNLNETRLYWEAVLQIEKKLGVSFNPKAEFPDEDARFFSELCACFIDKRQVVWDHPFDSFHLDGYVSSEPNKFDKDELVKIAIESKDITNDYIEGPISCSLLGTEFDLYSHTTMTDFIVTNVEWDNEKKESCTIYIDDVPGNKWKLKRFYLTKEEAMKLKEQRLKERESKKQMQGES